MQPVIKINLEIQSINQKKFFYNLIKGIIEFKIFKRNNS